MVTKKWIALVAGLSAVQMVSADFSAETLSAETIETLEVLRPLEAERNKAFTAKELEDARRDVATLLGEDLKALSQQKISAAALARKSKLYADDWRGQPRATRFLLGSGAMKLYAEAGDIANARRVLMFLYHEFPIDTVLASLKETKIDFGVACEVDDCPLVFRSLNTFREADLLPYGGVLLDNVVDMSSLKLNQRVEFSDKAREVNICYIKDPARPWYRRRSKAWSCTVVLRDAVGAVKRAMLYFSYKTKVLFEIKFAAAYASNANREVCISDMERLREEIKQNFGATTYVVNFSSRSTDEAARQHKQCLYEYKRIGDCDMLKWPYSSILTCRDCGVNGIRVEGAADEDLHHVKRLSVVIIDESAAAVAYQEGDGLKLQEFETRTALQYSSFLQSQEMELRMPQEKKRSMALIGRGYDRGLYGMTTNRAEAVSWYAKAYAEGNVEAGARLKEMGENLDTEGRHLLPLPSDGKIEEMSEHPNAKVTKISKFLSSPGMWTFAAEMMRIKWEMDRLRPIAEQLKENIFKVAKADLIKVREVLVRLQSLMDKIEFKKFIEMMPPKKEINKNQIALAISMIDWELQRRDRPILNLCAIVNGKRVPDAKVVCNGKEYTTPTTVSDLKAGDKFGPFTVTYEKDGKKYGKRFGVITADWTGEKTFTCTLNERK